MCYDGTDGRTGDDDDDDDDDGTRRDTTGRTDGENLKYLPKSKLMVYPPKQTRTDISGLA